jgi:hypothetical protein
VVYLKFEGATRIEKTIREAVLIGLLIIGAVGFLILCCLRSPVDHWSSYKKPKRKKGKETSDDQGTADNNSSDVRSDTDHELQERHTNPSTNHDHPHLELEVGGSGHWARFKRAMTQLLRLFLTPDMLLLSVTCFYTGIHFSFFGGVLSGAIGFTSAFGEDRAKYVGLSGILIGVGEVTGTAYYT